MIIPTPSSGYAGVSGTTTFGAFSHYASATITASHTSSAPSPSSTSIIPGIGRENWSSLIGILTAIVGNILISFALNLQRYAHIRLDRELEEKERHRKQARRTATGEIAQKRRQADGAAETEPLLARPRTAGRNSSETAGSRYGEAALKESYLRSPYWWTGIIMMTIGEAGNFLAYGFAPASIVSPLGVVALIVNCIIAPFMLKEHFRKRDAFGVVVAVAGAVVVVLSASDNNPKLGPDEIWDSIKRWEFEAYLAITAVVILVLMAASKEYGPRSILIDLGLVGLFGGYTALSTKGVASLLSYTLWRALTFPVFYLLIAVLIFTAIMQIKYVNRALQRFDSTQVIPTQFVLFTLSVILGSAILYRDFERTTGDDAGKFVGGCLLTFFGVWLITSGRPKYSDDDDEDREPEPEDAINLVNGEHYHDSVDVEVGSSTRRSSTIRASSPPIRIPDRAHSPSPPQTPIITFTPHDGTTPTLPAFIPDAPSPLIQNPWEAALAASPSPVPSLRPVPSPLITTYSTPVLPSEHQTSSLSPSRPQTPRVPSESALLPGVSPATPATAGPRLRRAGTIERLASRNSIAGPLLASPLSSSLSAVVAELRRGSLRGPRESGESGAASRRRGSQVFDTDGNGDGGALERARTSGEPETRTGSRAGRGRSFSGTLNELLRGFRGSKNNSMDSVDAEEREDGGR
ncbi:DUF803-domain-containing protein [Lophium mytilinum]|uniref:DUF803-domain-containing protein n=1 Tax=Lophium mytilinum TaxID=390894 RepID=A0A6A6QEB5_9PEZI|nr:DUF803-domain-containing protein [Lophium mytilinum]